MKKIYKFVLLILLLPLTAFSQAPHDTEVDSIKSQVVKFYNQDKEAAIYDRSSASFQKYISRDEFIDWLNGLRNSLGKIIQTKRIGNRNGTSFYRINFKKGIGILLLSVDKFYRISRFAIRLNKDYIVSSDNPLKSHIDSLVEKTIRPYIQKGNTVGVSIGVLINDQIYKYDYGETMKGNHQLPNANTIYEIGSITKTFTATLLAGLVLQGKCNLDDPVNKYLPDSIPVLQKGDVKITLKMLANHTSGLPRIPSDLFKIKNASFSDPYKNYDTVDLYHYLARVKLRTVPGTDYAYSNLGYGLLGTILERISGLSYQDLIRKYICYPLEMEDTRIRLNDTRKNKFATGYKANGQVAGHWHFKSQAGCGAIRSTVNDLLKYLKAHLTNTTSTRLRKAFRLCEKPTFDMRTETIGLAWLQPDKMTDIWWHNGGTGGFRSYCAYNKNKNVAVVILSNTAISVDKAGETLIKELLENIK